MRHNNQSRSRLASGKSALSARRWMRRIFAGIEPLECRTLLSVTVAPTGKSATYTDIDGDIVTVAVSKGTLTTGMFTNAISGELQVLDLTAAGFAGTNLTVTVKHAGNGDGLANIGYINASGNDLGTVSIAGDLGRMDAGDATLGTPAMKSLTVRTLGRLGLDSQGGTGNLTSNVVGALTSLTVKGDVSGALISVTGGTAGTLSTVSIGGSLIGTGADNSGDILATGNIGTVKIGGSIIGGTGINSGAVASSAGSIGKTTVSGSVIGGFGDRSGVINSALDLGAVVIGHTLQGGTGTFSGGVLASRTMSSVTVGSVIAGAGAQSGEIYALDDMGAVKISHNLQGGSGFNSGAIVSLTGSIAGVTVGGSLIGDVGISSGVIAAARGLGAVKISHDIQGGSGDSSGNISSASLTSLTVGGSIIGGTGDNGGIVDVSTQIGAAKIGGDIRGGLGANTGSLRSGSGAIASVTVGGSLIGAAGDDTGRISAGGALGKVSITHSVIGGAGDSSGLIQSGTGDMAGVSVGDSVFGGAGHISGAILSGGNITGAVSIGSDLHGGNFAGTSSLDQTGCIISAGRIASVTIGGSIFAGVNTGTGALTNSGAIRAGDDLGSLTVKGSLVGNQNATANTAVVISARGQAVQGATTDLAIGKITIGGRVEFANILAGFDTQAVAVNPDAQIGTVTVSGDWIASNLVAGAMNANSNNTKFGDVNDARISGGQASTDNAGILSTITSITIKGTVLGTPDSANPADHFGFVAESVKALSVNRVKITLNSAAHIDNLIVGLTGDVSVHEV